MNYAPIMLAKRGEISALKDFKVDQKKRIQPLLLLQPKPEGKTLVAHLCKSINTVKNNWGTTQPIAICLDSLWTMKEDGKSSLSILLEEDTLQDVKVIPAVSTATTQSFQTTIKKYLRTNATGICVRLNANELPTSINTHLKNILQKCECDRSQTDLVIDLGCISAPDDSLYTTYILSLIRNVESVSQYRSISMAGASMVNSIAGFPILEPVVIPRRELSIWKAVRSQADVKILFGDYTAIYPILPKIDPRLIWETLVAKIKYTSDDSWVIYRMHKIKEHGFEQYSEICKTLVSSTFYRNSEFSWGDSQIELCAELKRNTGNSETWVKIAVNHHIAEVLEQLSSMS